MQPITPSQLQALITKYEPCQLLNDQSITVGPDVVRDNRDVKPGALFVALPGEKVDGHDFAADAKARGAHAIMATHLTKAKLPHLIVTDCVKGLSALATGLVRKSNALVLAITGSSGKTSTKDLLAQILVSEGQVVSPIGSYNNEIGVPLTACEINDETKFLVSEMGSRGIGHIRWLTQIVPPEISVVLNVGSAHLGEFGSKENIAKAKAEIVEALPEDGWAVLNADDPLVRKMASQTKARIAWFSIEQADEPAGTSNSYADEQNIAELASKADIFVKAKNLVPDEFERFAFDLETQVNGETQITHVQLQIIGIAQAIDAAAAAAASLAAGLTPAKIAENLNKAKTRSPWRMELTQTPNGIAVLNDAYNANPDSMNMALETIKVIGQRRKLSNRQARVITILGDMLELGEQSAAMHHALGIKAVECGSDEIFALGQYAADIVRGAKSAGGKARIGNPNDLAATISLKPGDVLLIKASRALHLELVADEIIRAQSLVSQQEASQ